MFTIIGAILGFVVGGGLALLAFNAGMDSSHIDAEAQGWLLLFFSVPVFLSGGIIGLTVGALAGARMDRSREMMRRVLWLVYTVIGALFIVVALPTIISAALTSAWITIIGIAALAVGAALCFAGWRVGREM